MRAFPALSLPLLLLAACGSEAPSRGAVPGLAPRERAFVETERGFALSDAIGEGVATLDEAGLSLALGDEHVAIRALTGPGGVRLSTPAPELAHLDTLGLPATELALWEHDAVREWWSIAPDALEHGFVIAAAPAGEPVTVTLGVSGATLAPIDGGAALTTPSGRTLTYTGLSAWDADGHALPAEMTIGTDTLTLTVDAGAARFPVVIDPILTTSTTTLSGLSAGDASGAGDLDGDGYADVVAFDDTTGRLYWFLGSASGLSSAAAGSLSAYTFAADAVVDAAGDTNGDGYDDLVVGNPSASANRGQVLLFRGSASGLSSSAARTHTGFAVNTRMGLEVAGVGDTDGDGRDDYATVNASGVVSVFRGMPGTLTAVPRRVTVSDWTHTNSLSYLGTDSAPGHTLAGGDLNGDGYSDLVVGRADYDNGVSGYSPGPTGAVDIYFGSAAGISSSAQTVVWPYGYYYDSYASMCWSFQQFGFSVAVAGDTNSDGYDDLVVGIPGDCEYGSTVVYRGGASGVDDSEWAYFFGRDLAAGSVYPDGMMSGYSLGVGDFDGDGHGDFATGGGPASYVESHGVGFAWSNADAVSGTTAPLYATEIAGTDAYVYDWYATTLGPVDTVGDVDADGCDDLLVQNPTGPDTFDTVLYYGHN